MPHGADEAPERLSTFERASLLLRVIELQVAGTLPARRGGVKVDALLVSAGLTQSEVAWLLGKTQQSVSEAVKRQINPEAR